MTQAYKALDHEFKCRGFQFEVGKEYEVEGKVTCCENGFHACADPLDVLNYYDLIDAEGRMMRFALVEQSGESDTKGDKTCSSKIQIVKELTLDSFIHESVNRSFLEIDFESLTRNASSGGCTRNASSGGCTRNASSGDDTWNASSGAYTWNASSGAYTRNASSGSCTQNASSGDDTRNASSGDGTSTEINGRNSVTADIGLGSRVKGVEGTLVCLCHYVDNAPVKLVTGKIGEEGLKPNVWYALNATGEFEEVKP